MAGDERIAGVSHLRESRGQRLFFGFFLPLGVVANLTLGVLILTGLQDETWTGWLQIGTGAMCCVIAGWLAAAGWSRSYWNRKNAQNVAIWRRIADTIFGWLEEAPLPGEAIAKLSASLEEALPPAAQKQQS